MLRNYLKMAWRSFVPGNASAKFDCLINWADFVDDNKWAKEWGNTGPNTIVMLRKDANRELVDVKIRKALERYSSPNFRLELGIQRLGGVEDR